MPDVLSTHDIAIRLAALEADQKVTSQVLGLLVNSLEQQTALLTEIADAVRQEPGPSPIVQSLDELTAAVLRMGEGVETLHQTLADLPETLNAAVDGTEAAWPSQDGTAGASW
jgi:hypothetical protein